MIDWTHIHVLQCLSMHYSIDTQSDIQAVVVKAEGIINTLVAEQMVVDTGAFLKKTGLKRCIFDLVKTDVDPNQSMIEMFTFVRIFEKANIDKSVRMAALYVSGGEYRTHLEGSAMIEGFKLRHFTDYDEAVNWLCLL